MVLIEIKRYLFARTTKYGNYDILNYAHGAAVRAFAPAFICVTPVEGIGFICE